LLHFLFLLRDFLSWCDDDDVWTHKNSLETNWQNTLPNNIQNDRETWESKDLQENKERREIKEREGREENLP
jgi:hypothetical protein